MTAPTTIYTDRALHAYLRRATWGLPTGRQQELWDELEEHVLARADQLQVAGLSPAQALTQAIRELGPPGSVTLGMAKVYTMPKILIAAGTAALALSAALYAVAGGGGKTVSLPVSTNLPMPVCQPKLPENVRVTVVSNWENSICFFRIAPGYPTNKTIESELLVTQQAVEQVVAAIGGESHLQSNGILSISIPSFPTPVSMARITTRVNATNYFPAHMLLVPTSAVPQYLTGFQRPIIHAGNQQFSLNQDASSDKVMPFYESISPKLLSSLGLPWGYRSSPANMHSHSVPTHLNAGEVVMAVTRGAGDSYQSNFSEVLDGGELSIRFDRMHVAFVSDPQRLKERQPDGRTPVLLVRVTNIPLNQLRQGIFVPAQATSDAR